MRNCQIVFHRNRLASPKQLYHFTFPLALWGGGDPFVPYLHRHLILSVFFEYSYCSGYEVQYLFVFWFAFLQWLYVEHIFICLLAICIPSFPLYFACLFSSSLFIFSSMKISLILLTPSYRWFSNINFHIWSFFWRFLVRLVSWLHFRISMSQLKLICFLPKLLILSVFLILLILLLFF